MTDNFSRRQILKAAGGFVAGATSVGGISLISDLFTPAQAQQTEGSLVAIYTHGSSGSSGVKWYLNGLTTSGKVNLTTVFGGGNTGTRWRPFYEWVNGRYLYRYRCEGHLAGARWLNGLTGAGQVNLVSSYGGGNTGTRWGTQKAYRYNGEEVFQVICQGHLPGSKYLNGKTGTKEVDLSPSAGGVFTGALWKFEFAGV